MPGPAVDPGQVVHCQRGRLPLKAGLEPGRADGLADRARIVDHGRNGGLHGMFSVEGAKYTTARRVAEEVVDRVVAGLATRTDRCRTAEVRVDEDDGVELAVEAGVRRAVRDGMAVRPADVVLRPVWSGGPPGDAGAGGARGAGAKLGWSPTTRNRKSTT